MNLVMKREKKERKVQRGNDDEEEWIKQTYTKARKEIEVFQYKRTTKR